MGYKIITDSTIDMDHKMIEELGLTVVPLRFTIDGKTYKDKADPVSYTHLTLPTMEAV